MATKTATKIRKAPAKAPIKTVAKAAKVAKPAKLTDTVVSRQQAKASA